MSNAYPNAVELRLYQLFEQCKGFLNQDQARLLRWRIQEDENPMISAFLSIENSAEGELPVLFVESRAPFKGALQYEDALRVELRAVESALLESLSRKGMTLEPQTWLWDEPWPCLVSSFLTAYQRWIPGLVWVLSPQQISSLSGFAQWLTQQTQEAPERVRYILVEVMGQPSPGLERLEGEGMVTITADLDMPGAMLSILQDTQDLDAPAGQYNLAMQNARNAIASRQLDALKRAIQSACAVAQGQGWGVLESLALLTGGAGCSSLGAVEDALSAYQGAWQAARVAREQKGDEGAIAPELQAQMAIAGTHLLHKRPDLAATHYHQCFEQTAHFQPDQRFIRFESGRMACFSYEQAGRLDLAGQLGQEVLGWLETLTEPDRQGMYVAILGEQLEQVAIRQRDHKGSVAIDQRMTLLLGDAGWRAKGMQSLLEGYAPH